MPERLFVIRRRGVGTMPERLLVVRRRGVEDVAPYIPEFIRLIVIVYNLR
ncbi:MAG: hypothetical protein IJF09_07230 [Ruminiclostridium sp.]|nr:hypothetical protein [Ruminiclostridium sp.]